MEKHDMQTQIDLPKAFSVRDEHEFFPIQHLMARLNPSLMVTQVGTGVHVNGGCTVFWGLVYVEGQPPSREEVEAALAEAGFDFARNVVTKASELWFNWHKNARGIEKGGHADSHWSYSNQSPGERSACPRVYSTTDLGCAATGT